ncbi:MAG TPA: DUF3800 domain-containing protein [Thermococcus litoralis]|uniref:DUF3800 domain-containing protein n=1 Tax=Thermococcus litoralis TaxID=2265 RepID=A0A7C5JXJ7_THELI|nr:DUF3800 domain-containing protein [Thermococcus litoralis]
MTHLYIVLDEAGDLGFSEGSSQYFVMGAIILKADDVKKVRRIPKKARGKLGKKKKDIPELKASKSDDKIRRFILNELFKCPSAQISAVYVNKKNTYSYIRNNSSQKAAHYNYTARVLIVDSLKLYLDRIGYTSDKALTVEVYLDHYHTTKFRKKNLEEYIQKMITEAIPYGVKVTVHQKDSRAEPLIQVADFVVNAFYRRLDGRGDFIKKFEDAGKVLKFKQIY